MVMGKRDETTIARANSAPQRIPPRSNRHGSPPTYAAWSAHPRRGPFTESAAERQRRKRLGRRPKRVGQTSSLAPPPPLSSWNWPGHASRPPARRAGTRPSPLEAPHRRQTHTSAIPSQRCDEMRGANRSGASPRAQKSPWDALSADEEPRAESPLFSLPLPRGRGRSKSERARQPSGVGWSHRDGPTKQRSPQWQTPRGPPRRGGAAREGARQAASRRTGHGRRICLANADLRDVRRRCRSKQTRSDASTRQRGPARPVRAFARRPRARAPSSSLRSRAVAPARAGDMAGRARGARLRPNGRCADRTAAQGSSRRRGSSPWWRSARASHRRRTAEGERARCSVWKLERGHSAPPALFFFFSVTPSRADRRAFVFGPRSSR